MNIKKYFALLIALLLITSSFAGCRKIGADESAFSSVNSDFNVNYSNVEISENDSESQSDEDTTSDIQGASGTPSGTGSSGGGTSGGTSGGGTSGGGTSGGGTSGDGTSGGGTSGGGTSGDGTSGSGTSGSGTSGGGTSGEGTSGDVEEPTININPDGVEIYGSGTADDPYLDTPNADTHIVKTLVIPAGTSVFYSIYRVGGRMLTIDSSNVFVVCDGKKHTQQNGTVSFKVVDALASEAVSFEIGNTGATDVSFTIKFIDEHGSMQNPTVIQTIGDEVSLDLAEGNETGHFYKYTAKQTGTLKLYILSGTEKGILLATNNRNSAQRSTESSEEGEVKTDELGTYIELEVENGDEIVINVGAKPNKRGKYPAITIKWLAKY